MLILAPQQMSFAPYGRTGHIATMTGVFFVGKLLRAWWRVR
jgi:hypothetical protein